MNIRMVDLVTQYQKLKPEIDAAIQDVLCSGQFVMGKVVREFEEEVERYLAVKHAIGCASGTDALQIAMMALGVRPGDEIITTPFTFVATAETMVLLGAVPVYVDIDEKTFNIDPRKIESAITHRTVGIVPVHLYGQTADMDPILELAEKHHLWVLEDAAQAFGAEYRGKKAGTFGIGGCISFFPSKNLGAYGDGGMVVTNDDAFAEKVRLIAQHGSRTKYEHLLLGVNSRLDSLQAAVLKVKLRYLDNWNQMRQAHAARYSELLRDAKVKLPITAPDRNHIFHQYTILLKDRDGLAEHFRQKGIPFGIHYPLPLHLQPAFAHLGKKEGDFPIAERSAREVFSLPMHPELTEDQIQFVATAVREYTAGLSLQSKSVAE